MNDDNDPFDNEGETVDVIDDRLESRTDDPRSDELQYKNQEWMYQQYHGVGRSLQEIADICGVREKTIWRWMDRHGIETRSGGPQPGPWKNEEWLRNQYERKSIQQIADEQDCDEKTIRNWITEHGIETRNPSEQHPAVREGRQYHDKEWLRHQYKELEKSSTEIAKQCETKRNVILHWLHRHDIEVRDREEAAQLAYSSSVRVPADRDDGGAENESVTQSVGSRSYSGPETGVDVSYTSDLTDGEMLESPWRDEEWLRKQYEKHGSSKPIADLCGLTPDAIRYWMDKFDIERERTGGRRESPKGVELYRNEEWLKRKYDEHGTVAAIVREEPVDVTEGAIKYWMDQHGIERENAGAVGPKARREKGLMTYDDLLDALVAIYKKHDEWPTSTNYDDYRPSGSPSSSKAYQFSEFAGWSEAIKDAKQRLQSEK